MLRAITRAVSRQLARCELTFKEREGIDYERAARQQEAYCRLLERCGVAVFNLEASDALPDCCFVADTAVVLDELAVIANMGASSRRRETAAAEKILSNYRQVARIEPPATLDGGDVVRLGKQLFVGRSARTNEEGIAALARLTREFGYSVTPVCVTGSLHLTTACSALDEETVLLNPCWIDDAPFAGLRVLCGPEQEPWAASTLRVGQTICVEAEAPRTRQLVEQVCPRVEALDISEFRKAEGSLSCLSLLFRDDGRPPQPPQNFKQNKEVTHAE
ncbi:MAG: dimethylargininase [Blastocatellia bacterium]|jgi:dimethylargininase|nr:dimethylargininase [Blastocatellia bacterium]